MSRASQPVRERQPHANLFCTSVVLTIGIVIAMVPSSDSLNVGQSIQYNSNAHRGTRRHYIMSRLSRVRGEIEGKLSWSERSKR